MISISADLYIIIFHIIVVIATIMLLSKFNSTSQNIRISNETKKGFYLALFLSLFIGFRPIDLAFVDMITYTGRFEWFKRAAFDYDLDTENVIFDNLMLYAAKKDYAIEIFFLVITSIYYLPVG